ncbi:NAD(P)-dependent dehydrogenase (short-subunit alcohol dehydrogenase family) [Nocardioides daedukensis]|uniref:NAD(P)-dependent dehydrogenase (Short-subunit alcohol dehydrogenase family) n=1 Tax=Nocardioides daedukensis TaxID=634462 RepID=A0A7Y9S4F7_9ACTN|nr:SDR family oxidoreductase [Nocardioides daedukensis]NYG59903.1 NAD(P)-dependent dehydrogenase (short-subunit alcohol dehydrogenase family) [Nocardioides daedukensis]
MTGQLEGRVAIITGAGDGIGAGVARGFAAEGAVVVVAELNEEKGRAVAAEVGGSFIRTDVSQRDQVEAMVQHAVDQHGGVDILVNNAWGRASISRVENKTDDNIENALAVGFRGPLWAMQAVYPRMKAKGWGRVINMVSLNGVNAHVGTLEYNTAKEALRALTRTAAREWAPSGVVVNAIAPGAKSAAYDRVMAGNPALAAQVDGMNPMGRLGDPLDDIAPVAIFLASEGARYVTGNTVFADGGGHINGVAWQPELDD